MAEIIAKVEEVQKANQEKLENDLFENIMKQIEDRQNNEIVIFNIPHMINDKTISCYEVNKVLEKIFKLFEDKASFIFLELDEFKICKYFPKLDFLKRFKSTFKYTEMNDMDDALKHIWKIFNNNDYIAIKFKACNYRNFMSKDGYVEYDYVTSLLT